MDAMATTLVIEAAEVISSYLNCKLAYGVTPSAKAGAKPEIGREQVACKKTGIFPTFGWPNFNRSLHGPSPITRAVFS